MTVVLHINIISWSQFGCDNIIHFIPGGDADCRYSQLSRHYQPLQTDPVC